ncbi:unnamed protein product [Closterium sp. NIES-53]
MHPQQHSSSAIGPPSSSSCHHYSLILFNTLANNSGGMGHGRNMGLGDVLQSHSHSKPTVASDSATSSPASLGRSTHTTSPPCHLRARYCCSFPPPCFPPTGASLFHRSCLTISHNSMCSLCTSFHSRAKRFVHCGDWSRSLAALKAGELAPPTPETVTVLKAKHPLAPEELPDWLSNFSPPKVLQLTIPLLHQALRSAPHGTAAGPSGWLIERSHLPHLLHLFQNWLQGDLPQTVRPYFTASTLVALQKPQGGVRPIAIGEILPRLLSRCVALHFKQKIRDFFLPSLQFGVAVSAGIEVMAHAVQSALSLHPDWVVLELDVANAFNSFSRSSMFNALQDSPFSSLIPFFRLFYASLSSLHYRGSPLIETLQSSSGVR